MRRNDTWVEIFSFETEKSFQFWFRAPATAKGFSA
jgi:hypothetical protein